MKPKLLLVVGITLIVYGIAASIVRVNTEVELRQLDSRVKQAEINDLNKQIDKIEKSDKSNSKRIRELKEKNLELQQALQAKLLRDAENASNVVYAAPVAPVGTCSDWMAAAGITDTANAYELIIRESGCNPNAVNPSSGACGIGQQLPCGKWAHIWNEPIGAMIDMQSYVMDRYGSWAAAVAFHNSHNWY